MAITLYADATDVRAAYEGTIPTDEKTNARLDALIRRACGKLSQLVPSLDGRMARGEVDPEVPAGMVVEAVLRVWRNPAGMVQEGVGPFQASRNARASMNEIIFDSDDISRLLGESNTPRSIQVHYAGRQRPVEPSVDAVGVTRYRRIVPGV